jgi:hypothetical protein
MEALRRIRLVWSILILAAGGWLAVETFLGTYYWLTGLTVVGALLMTGQFYAPMRWFVRPALFITGAGLMVFATTPLTNSNGRNEFELLTIALVLAPVILVAGWIVDALVPRKRV